jgi:hypothetical protein
VVCGFDRRRCKCVDRARLEGFGFSGGVLVDRAEIGVCYSADSQLSRFCQDAGVVDGRLIDKYFGLCGCFPTLSGGQELHGINTVMI